MEEKSMTFKVEIFTQNIENTERIRDYVNKKISKLDRFLKGIEETRVDLASVKSARSSADRQVAQITIRGKGFILRSEERADDLFTALDAALEKIQRQIERFKGKRSRVRNTNVIDVEMATDTIEDEEDAPVIAKRKEFDLIPMDELDAVDQMSLLGHENFFVFFNANTNQINVIYKRRDGSYGIITPKVG
jgi:putative sigma-54 modulation protein